MGSLFESPRIEPQPMWERLPPDIRDIYTNFLRQYANFIGQLGGMGGQPGGGGFLAPSPPPSVNIGPVRGVGPIPAVSVPAISVGTIREPTLPPLEPVRLPEELRQRYMEVLRGGFDPSTSPGMQAIIRRMEEGGRRATDLALHRLAMAGQGPGTPMAQATAEIAGATQARIGEALQEALNREYQAALGMLREGMGADIQSMWADLSRNMGLMQAQQARDIAQVNAQLQADIARMQAQTTADVARMQAQVQADIATMRAQLDREIAQASLELQRYGMVTQDTFNRYMLILQALQGAAGMATGLLGSFLPPPQYAPPPIVSILGPLASILGIFWRR